MTLLEQFIEAFELTLLDKAHPIAIIIQRMRNGGYHTYELGTSPTTHHAVVTFTHETGETVSGEAQDVVEAFKRALDAGLEQTRARRGTAVQSRS